MQMKEAMFWGSLLSCPEREMLVPFRTAPTGSLTPRWNQDVSLGKPQNLSDPQLILLQNVITSVMVEAVGSNGEF